MQLHTFTQEWLNAWNAHDLDAILAHYSDDIDFISPIIRDMGLHPEGRIRDKTVLRDYFSRALQRYPDLQFVLHQSLSGAQSLVLYYQSVQQTLSAEYMECNDQGLICKVRAHYSAATDLYQLADQWLQHWTSGADLQQADRLLDYYTEDCYYADPAAREGIRGKRALKPYLQKLLRHNPRWRFRRTELIPTAKGCVLKWEAHIPAGTDTLVTEGLDILELDQGKISRNEVFFDRHQWLRCLTDYTS